MYLCVLYALLYMFMYGWNYGWREACGSHNTVIIVIIISKYLFSSSIQNQAYGFLVLAFIGSQVWECFFFVSLSFSLSQVQGTAANIFNIIKQISFSSIPCTSMDLKYSFRPQKPAFSPSDPWPTQLIFDADRNMIRRFLLSFNFDWNVREKFSFNVFYLYTNVKECKSRARELGVHMSLSYTISNTTHLDTFIRICNVCMHINTLDTVPAPSISELNEPVRKSISLHRSYACVYEYVHP